MTMAFDCLCSVSQLSAQKMVIRKICGKNLQILRRKGKVKKISIWDMKEKQKVWIWIQICKGNLDQHYFQFGHDRMILFWDYEKQ